jgi:pyruvate carboxylase
MLKGNLGQPPGGWPEGIVKKVLKGEKPASTDRPGKHLPPSIWKRCAPRSRPSWTGHRR